MLPKTIIPTLVALAYAHVVAANPQVTTVIPFMVSDGTAPVPEGEEVVSGVIIGTGANGETTYLFSIGDETEEPATATFIGGPSGATAIVAFTDEFDSSVATQSIACSFQDGNADCIIEVAGEVDSVPTTVSLATSGPVDSFTLVVSTSIAEEASNTATAADAEDTSGAWRNPTFGVFASSFALVFAAVMA